LLDTGDGSAGAETSTGAGAVGFGQWHLVSAAINRTAGTVSFYVDGTAAGGGAVTTDFVNTADLNLGRFTNGALYFKGALDEARIQSGVPSPNWMWADWMTVAANSTLEKYSAVTQAAPPLTISTESGGGVSLSWPLSAVGFALVTATNLAMPVDWTPVTNALVLANNQWQVSLSPGIEVARFYRLQFQ
jgi:hypothetical protein